ncbi:MAG TPA: calcium-binding protein [Allosphingosinicella sp.]
MIRAISDRKAAKIGFAEQSSPFALGHSVSDAMALGQTATDPMALGLTITGTGGNDTLNGTNDDDTINGGAGNDTINGNGGNDTIDGGDGFDTLDGGAGNDIVLGGYGDDIAKVTGGTTSADTGTDSVDLSGRSATSAGDDHLIVDYAAITENVTHGGSGLTSGATGFGGTYQVGGQTRLTYSGVDRLTIATGSGNDLVRAVSFDDIITTGAGNDVIYAPTLAGGGGVRIDGGAGVDTVYGVNWSDMDRGVQVYLNGAGGFGTAGRYITGVESLIDFTATAFDDTVDLHSSGLYSNRVSTGGGVDEVIVYGGTTAATTGLQQLDLGNTGTGFDLIRGRYQAVTEQMVYTQTGRHGELTIAGQVRGEFDGMTRVFLQFGSGNDIADNRGSNGLIELLAWGGAGDDIIYGSSLGDELQGGIGNDQLVGGAGDDYYGVDSLGDMVVELPGEGLDWVQTSVGSRTDYEGMYVLPDNVENLIGIKSSAQGVYGNALNNLVRLGGGGDLIVMWDGGVDKVEAGGGNDYIFYGAAFTNADANDGGEGKDTLALLGNYNIVFDDNDIYSIEQLALYSSGNAAAPNNYTFSITSYGTVRPGSGFQVLAQSLMANETLTFSGVSETNARYDIRGGRGNDTITTGNGDDMLRGGLGADTLRGGAGRDTFDYYDVAESTQTSRDKILDFQLGEKINLGGIDADGNAANGDSRFTFIGSAAFSGTAPQLRVYQDTSAANTWIVEGDTNGDHNADFSLVVVTQDGHAMGIGDFWF